MTTSTASDVLTSISDAPATPAREGIWARIDRVGTRLVVDDPTFPELPQPADYGLALPWSDAFASAETVRWRRRAHMLTARGCLRLVVAVVCLVVGGVDLSHGRILLGLAELWAGLVQLVVCWVPLGHAAYVRQELPRLTLQGRSGLGILLDDAATEPRRPSPAEVDEWDLADDERLWAVLDASTVVQRERTRRGRTETEDHRVPVVVAVTSTRLVCRTATRSWSAPWSRVEGVGARLTARRGTALTVWHAQTADADLELWRVNVPAPMTTHALSRLNLACASAAGARDAYLAGLATAGVPYQVRGPASSW